MAIDLEKSQSQLALGTQAMAIAGQAWAVIETLFNLPSIGARALNQLLGEALPSTAPLPGTANLLLAALVLGMWYPKWRVVTGMFGKVPFVGPFLAFYLHYSLFAAARGVAEAGWANAVALLVVTLAFNAPAYLKKAATWAGVAWGIGAGASKKGFKAAGTVAGASRKLVIRDPAQKELLKSFERGLQTLYRQYVAIGVPPADILTRLNEKVEKEVSPEHQDLAHHAIQKLISDNAIVAVETSPAVEVVTRRTRRLKSLASK